MEKTYTKKSLTKVQLFLFIKNLYTLYLKSFHKNSFLMTADLNFS